MAGDTGGSILPVGSDANDSGADSRSGASALHRTPTWAREIDFGPSVPLGISSPKQPHEQEGDVHAGPSQLGPVAETTQHEKKQSISSTKSSPRPSFLPPLKAQGNRMISTSPSPSPVMSRRVSPQTSFSGPPPGAALPYTAHSRQSSGHMVYQPVRTTTPDAYGPTLVESTPRPAHRSESDQTSRHTQRMPGWSVPSAQLTQFGSSADAYALPSMPIRGGGQDLLSTQDERARAGAVTPGGDSHGTHFTNESGVPDLKRISHLSFKTAASGLDGSRSVEDSNDGETRGVAIPGGKDKFEELRGVGFARQTAASSPSGYASSSDRPLPGAWSSGGQGMGVSSPFLGRTVPNRIPSDPASGEHFESARPSPATAAAPLPAPSTARHSGQGSTISGGSGLSLSTPTATRPSGSRFEEWDLKRPSHNDSPPPQIRQGEYEKRDSKIFLERNGTVKPMSTRQSLQGPELTPREPSTLPFEVPNSGTALPPVAARQSVPIEDVEYGPAVPEKARGLPPPSAREAPPPTPPKEASSFAPSSHRPELLALDLVPPPLPRDVVAHTPDVAQPTSPVSDYRRRPLADTSVPASSARTSVVGPGIGAHNVNAGKVLASSSPPSPDEAKLRRASAAGLLPRAALVEGPVVEAGEPSGRPESTSSVETPSREPSPPPEGEVEARAEWERARMKQKRKPSGTQQNAARRSTFRGQLKPLQMMSTDAPQELVRDSGGESPSTKTAFASMNKVSSGAMSTQQLQKQQARDQRRSVGTINLAMGAMGGADMVSGVNGPYPMFHSPSQGATQGGRQYLGMLPQRSLVPPFELQQRPDGLLSGLIGPDGVRRSINDPEVCLECMMRDEDMIDVDVLGPGLWERESDRDFDEALRLEREEDLKKDMDRATSGPGTASGSGGPGDDLSAADHSSRHAASREGSSRNASGLTKVRVKRVGKHDPLTSDRLKLHTQMNPPASSHRWRTLQSFLAVQAKYIAIDQKLRQEEWNRTHGGAPAGVTERFVTTTGTASVGGSVPTSVEDSGRRSPEVSSTGRKAVSKNRSVPLLMPQRGAKLVSDEDLRPEEKAVRDRDVALAREARRKNATSDSASFRVVSGTASSTPARMGLFSADEERRALPGALPLGSAAPRRPGQGDFSSPVRGASSSDLRSVPGSMLSPAIPSTPESLIPPSAAFGSMGTPKGFGVRTVSQLSLAPSGSMMDMHLTMASSNQADHRAGHGPALTAYSPAALSRPGSSPRATYFGFPGDGEMSPGEPSAPYRTDTIRGDELQSPPLNTISRDDGGYFKSRKKDAKGGTPAKDKKGFRKFISKFSGAGGTGSNGLSSPAPEDRHSEDSNSLQPRRTSLSADSGLVPPPGIAGLLSRARRSTSSLLGGRDSMDSPREMYMQPPLNSGSRNRFDMGPFQSPLPPERKQSRLSPEERATSPIMAIPRRNQSNNHFVGSLPPNRVGGASPLSGTPSSTKNQDSRLSNQGSSMFSNSMAVSETPASSRTPSVMSLQNRTEANGGTSQSQRQPSRSQPPLDAIPGRGSSSQQVQQWQQQSQRQSQSMLSAGDDHGVIESGSRRPSAALSVNSLPPGRPDRSPRRGNATLANGIRQASGPAVLPEQTQRLKGSGSGRNFLGPLTSPGRSVPKGSDYTTDDREELQDEPGSPRSAKGGGGDNRKSKLLRLPFGFSGNSNNESSSSSSRFKKRNSTAVPASLSSNSGLGNNGSGGYYAGPGEEEEEAGDFPPLRPRASTNAFDHVNVTGNDDEHHQRQPRPRKSINLFERPRALSSTSSNAGPPRSQSAFGDYPMPLPSGGGGFASKLRSLRGGGGGGGGGTGAE